MKFFDNIIDIRCDWDEYFNNGGLSGDSWTRKMKEESGIRFQY